MFDGMQPERLHAGLFNDLHHNVTPVLKMAIS